MATPPSTVFGGGELTSFINKKKTTLVKVICPQQRGYRSRRQKLSRTNYKSMVSEEMGAVQCPPSRRKFPHKKLSLRFPPKYIKKKLFRERLCWR